MKKIIIAKDRVRAVVLPDFGGAVAQLQIDGIDVLRMNYASLGTSNVLAGGIPVLFPLVSKSRDDEVSFDGARYTMPMHGFVKELPFETLRAWDSGCELRLSACELTRRFYPFDFALTLRYEIVNQALKTTMRVENHGAKEMPFAAGYHPFFLTPDRARTRFRFGLKEYWDYTRMDAQGRPAQGQMDHELRLADAYDTVFWNGDPDCELVNEQLGYRARLKCGESFGVVTVCTALENASCVEPWQARPGAIERSGECLRLAPGGAGEYSYSIELETI